MSRLWRRGELTCPCCGKRGVLKPYCRRFDVQRHHVEICVCVHCTALVNRTELAAATKDPSSALCLQTESASKFYYIDVNDALEQVGRAEKVVQFLLDSANSPIERRQAVDFGAGTGHMVAALAKHFDRAFAIDSNQTTLDRFIPVYGMENLAAVRDIDDIEGQFDAIVVWHTFEHLPAAYPVAARLASRLKRGGVMFWQVPMYRDTTVVHTHFTFFNETSASFLGKSAGLSLRQVWHDQENQFLTCLSMR